MKTVDYMLSHFFFFSFCHKYSKNKGFVKEIHTSFTNGWNNKLENMCLK